MEKEKHQRLRRNKKIPFETVAEAYRQNWGNVTLTCKQLGIDKNTFKAWKEDYPEFAELVEEAENTNLDFAESKLLKAIGDDNLTAIIFFLKTKGKKRGYIESQIISADVTTNRKMTQEEAIDFIKGLEQEY